MKIVAFLKKEIKESYTGWLFALPLVIGLAVFTFYPIIMSLVYSFHDFDGFKRFESVGFENFSRLFTSDGEIWKVFLNTGVFAAVSVPLILITSYLLAVLVNRKMGGTSFFRLLYYLPVVIPGVVSGVIWKDILNPSQGAFNSILNALGLPGSTFLSAASTSMFTVILMGMWGIGGSMILWLAALKNIPEQLYESARLEGAGVFRLLIHITIPMSTSMIFYNLIMGIIGALQTNATMVYAPRDGRGIDNSIYFVCVKIYREAFVRFDMGYASALAWVLFLVIGLLTAAIFATSKWVFYGEES